MSENDQLTSELANLRLSRDEPKAKGSGGAKIVWIVVAVVVLGGVGFVASSRTQDKLFPEEAELGVVALVSPSQQDVTLVATGYVYSRRRATVAPKVQGRIAKLFVDEGDRVTDNQVVAELESADAVAQVAQVRADTASAKAKAERARADVMDAQTKFSREEKLLHAGAGTPAAFDDAKAKLDSAKAQLVAAEADVVAAGAHLQSAQIALENTKVRAPFGGIVIRKLAEVGEMATLMGASGASGIFNIAELDNLEVQADVSEAQLGKVSVGTPAEILLDAFPDKRFRGAVKEIRQTVDRAKASVTVKVGFTDDSKGVLPDMAAKVSFLAKALDQEALKVAPKLVAPQDAVIDRDGKKVLFAVTDGTVHEVSIAVKGPVGAMVELASGPAAGTKVVRHPSPKLHDGSSVKEKDK